MSYEQLGNLDAPRANCSDVLPYVGEFFNELPVEGKVLIGISGALTLSTIMIFMDELRYVRKSHEQEDILYKTTWLLSLYPAISATSFIAIVVPRSCLIDQILASGYLAVVIHKFLRLMVLYYGGKEAFLHAVSKTKISLRSPPLACCCCCCPAVVINKKYYGMISVSVLQCAFVRPIVQHLSAVLWTEGVFVEGMLTHSTINTVFGIISALSTLIAMYGLILIYRASKTNLKHYHIVPKYVCFYLVLIVNNIQILVFSVLSANGAFPCIGTLSSKITGNVVHHGLVTVEMFLLALMARFYYMKTLRGVEPYNIDTVTENGIAQGNCTSVVEIPYQVQQKSHDILST